MSRVLVTGMSGVRKSTILVELRRRGLLVVDTDDDGWELSDGTWDETVEPLLRRGASLELDGRLPVAELADAVERLVTTP